VEAENNSRATSSFNVLIPNKTGVKEALKLSLNYRERAVQFYAEDSLSRSYPLAGMLKVTISKSNAKVLTVLVQTNPNDPTTKTVLNAQAASTDARDSLFSLLCEIVSTTKERNALNNEMLRIIRKSGYIEVGGELSAADKKKGGAATNNRFAMITPAKLFIFRDSKGVWCPLQTIFLKDLKFECAGKQLVLTKDGKEYFSFSTGSAENTADWYRLSVVESKRAVLPDPTRGKQRIQDDDEVAQGIIPIEPTDEPVPSLDMSALGLDDEPEPPPSPGLPAEGAAAAEEVVPPAQAAEAAAPPAAPPPRDVDLPVEVFDEEHDHAGCHSPPPPPPPDDDAPPPPPAAEQPSKEPGEQAAAQPLEAEGASVLEGGGAAEEEVAAPPPQEKPKGRGRARARDVEEVDGVAVARQVIAESKDKLRHLEGTPAPSDGDKEEKSAWEEGVRYDFSKVLTWFKTKEDK